MVYKIRTVMSLMGLGILVALAGNQSFAQDSPKPKVEAKSQDVYRLDFVVSELEGETRINSRSYTMSARLGDWGKIRVGSQIPFATSDKTFQYQDIGISIDCRPDMQEDGLLLITNFESSSVVRENEPHASDIASAGSPVYGAGGNPIRRRVSFNGAALVSLGKPAIIARLDDVGTNRRYQIEVTAMKVK